MGKSAERISDLSATKLRLLHKLAAFPESFASDLSRFELDTMKAPVRQAATIGEPQDQPRWDTSERALYGFEAHYGCQAPFEFEDREHAECLAEALRNQKHQNIRSKDVLSWRLPVAVAG